MSEQTPDQPRRIGAFGRKQPRVAAPAIPLGDVLTGVVPAHPLAQDNLANIEAWKMLGNDRAGDCVSVTWANDRRLVSTLLAGQESYPTQDMVWQVYRTQNKDFDPNGDEQTNGPGSNADQGMFIQELLNYLVKNGGPDGVKPLAFAKVNHHDLDQVRAALAIFGSLWVGVTVTNANEQQFARSRPWDYVSGSPELGGHAIMAAGYTGQAARDVRFVTWATETEFTDNFWTHQVDEAWAVIWPEHAGTRQFSEAVDKVALQIAYKSLTGRDLVLPDTPAPPAPTTDPGAAPFLGADPAVAERVARAARLARPPLSPAAWLNRHLKSYFRL
jgi:hypothetical protein